MHLMLSCNDYDSDISIRGCDRSVLFLPSYNIIYSGTGIPYLCFYTFAVLELDYPSTKLNTDSRCYISTATCFLFIPIFIFVIRSAK